MRAPRLAFAELSIAFLNPHQFYPNGNQRLSPSGPGGFLSNCYHGEIVPLSNLCGTRVRFHDSPQRLRRRDLAGSRSSSSTSSTRHGIQHIEFRAIHGTNVLDLSPRPARGVPRSLAIARVRPERHRLADRQDPDHRAVRRAPRAVRPGSRAGRLLRDAPDPDLQLLHPSGRRPGRAPDEVMTRMAELASRAADRGVTLLARERERDLRRHRRARSRPARDRRLPGPRRMPSTRPTTWRSASRSTRPGTCSDRGSSTSTSRTTTQRRTSTFPPAKATARFPACSNRRPRARLRWLRGARAAPGRRRAVVRLHRPRAVRRRRRRPQGHPRRTRRSPYA